MKHAIQIIKYSAACATVALAITSAQAADHSTTSTGSSSQTDPHATKFLKEAALDNNMEMAMTKAAIEKTQNSELKSFAQRLIKDHQEAGTRLTSLAQKHGVASPSDTENTLKKTEKLTKLSGAEFDKAFATAALKDHQKDIAKYEKAVKQVQAEDVRQFAEQVLPKLRSHLQHAATVAQAVGVDQSTISSYTKAWSETQPMGGTGDGEMDNDGTTFDSDKNPGAKNQQGHGAHLLKEHTEK